MTTSSLKPIFHGIFDKATWTITYIVHQGKGTACAIIDSVLDYDPKSGRTTTTSAEKIVDYVNQHQLTVEWILETHAHADHISAAQYLKKHLGGKTAIGNQITQIQKVFKEIFKCDFPGGDARTLYASTRRILSLPSETRLFMCHDYPPTERPIAFETTVAEQRAKNIHVHDGIAEAQFVEIRAKRDATLEMPVLIMPAVQINIRAGELPPKETNGVSYVKIPLNAL